MTQLAEKQNHPSTGSGQEYEDNGLSSSLIKRQLDAAQHAARQAQDWAKKQNAQMSRVPRTGTAGPSANPLLPGISDIQSASGSQDESETGNDTSADADIQSLADKSGNSQVVTGEEVEQWRANSLRIAQALDRNEKERQAEQAEEEGGTPDEAENAAQRGVSLMVWLAENNYLTNLAIAIPATFGFSIFVLDFIWIINNMAGWNLWFVKKPVIGIAKKSRPTWPIEATFILLIVTLIYLAIWFLVLAIVAMLISFMMMGTIEKTLTIWDWGFKSIDALMSWFK